MSNYKQGTIFSRMETDAELHARVKAKDRHATQLSIEDVDAFAWRWGMQRRIVEDAAQQANRQEVSR